MSNSPYACVVLSCLTNDSRLSGRFLALGACTYDVCTERGGGGTPKADAVRKLSKGGCVKMQTRGGGGQNIRKFCRRHMYMAPNGTWTDATPLMDTTDL